MVNVGEVRDMVFRKARTASTLAMFGVETPRHAEGDSANFIDKVHEDQVRQLREELQKTKNRLRAAKEQAMGMGGGEPNIGQGESAPTQVMIESLHKTNTELSSSLDLVRGRELKVSQALSAAESRASVLEKLLFDQDNLIATPKGQQVLNQVRQNQQHQMLPSSALQSVLAQSGAGGEPGDDGNNSGPFPFMNNMQQLGNYGSAKLVLHVFIFFLNCSIFEKMLMVAVLVPRRNWV